MIGEFLITRGKEMYALARRCLRCSRGIAVAEFAVVAPFILLFLLGTVETTRTILLHQKLGRTAMSMGNLISQSQEISTDDMDLVFNGVPHLTFPYDFATNGRVIISSVGNHGNDGIRVNWQHAGAGSYSASSAVGGTGQIAQLPAGFVLRDGEDVIVAEVYYDFQALLLSSLFPDSVFYKYAIFRPRLGALDTLAP